MHEQIPKMLCQLYDNNTTCDTFISYILCSDKLVPFDHDIMRLKMENSYKLEKYQHK